MRTASVDLLALGSVMASASHALPTIFTWAAGILGTIWYGVQIYDRFHTHHSSYEPPANEAVRDWHRPEDRPYDGPNLP
jgi:hypothetical protein